MTAAETAGKLALRDYEDWKTGISLLSLRDLAVAHIFLRAAAKQLVDILGNCVCSDAYTERKLSDPKCLFHRNEQRIRNVWEALAL